MYIDHGFPPQAISLYQRALTEKMLQSILKPEQKDSDAYRTIVEVIESRGFRCETHDIETKDGYILSVHRIVNPTLSPDVYRR